MRLIAQGCLTARVATTFGTFAPPCRLWLRSKHQSKTDSHVHVSFRAINDAGVGRGLPSSASPSLRQLEARLSARPFSEAPHEHLIRRLMRR
jgi:hypothetical protein